jgi:hypothetical protein
VPRIVGDDVSDCSFVAAHSYGNGFCRSHPAAAGHEKRTIRAQRLAKVESSETKLFDGSHDSKARL